MSITQRLAELPKSERLMCMEPLRDSLRADNPNAPAWHGKVLDTRKAPVESGDAGFVSEKELRQRVEELAARFRPAFL